MINDRRLEDAELDTVELDDSELENVSGGVLPLPFYGATRYGKDGNGQEN
jgi:bacteriocin-like protein